MNNDELIQETIKLFAWFDKNKVDNVDAATVCSMAITTIITMTFGKDSLLGLEAIIADMKEAIERGGFNGRSNH